MKVEKIDLIWAVVSMFIVGISFQKRMLIQGLILIYLLMVMIFVFHIMRIRKRMSGCLDPFGTVTGYHTAKGRKKCCFPIVKYDTKTGREITSVYSVADSEMRFETGDVEIICYDPDDPTFFYFNSRKDELTRDYYRFIIFGGVIAVMLLFYLLIKK